MTTIVVCRKNGVACIGADTLVSYGTTLEPADFVASPGKLLQVDQTHLAVAGPSAGMLAMRSHFRDEDNERGFDDVDQIFETFRQLHRAMKKRYYLNPKEDEDAPFESIQMECLAANATGIYGIFSLRSVAEYRRFFALGSGCEYALGAMHAVYDTLENAEDIARVGLEAGAAFDNASAAPFEVRSVGLAEPNAHAMTT